MLPNQILAIIALLVAFGVPQNTINNVQAILEQQSAPISSPAPMGTTISPLPASSSTQMNQLIVQFDPLIVINLNGKNVPTDTTVLPVDKNAYFNVILGGADGTETYTWSDDKGILWSGNLVSDMTTGLLVPDKGLYYKPSVGTHTLTFSLSNASTTISSSVTITAQ